MINTKALYDEQRKRQFKGVDVSYFVDSTKTAYNLACVMHSGAKLDRATVYDYFSQFDGPRTQEFRTVLTLYYDMLYNRNVDAQLLYSCWWSERLDELTETVYKTSRTSTIYTSFKKLNKSLDTPRIPPPPDAYEDELMTWNNRKRFKITVVV